MSSFTGLRLSVTHNYVDDIIQNTKPVSQSNGNWSYNSGNVQVITTPGATRVITIITN